MLEGKKGTIVIDKKPSGELSCSIVGKDRPSEKPKKKVAKELDELWEKSSPMDLSTQEGREKSVALKEIAKLCNEVDGNEYQDLKRAAAKLARNVNGADQERRGSTSPSRGAN